MELKWDKKWSALDGADHSCMYVRFHDEPSKDNEKEVILNFINNRKEFKRYLIEQFPSEDVLILVTCSVEILCSQVLVIFWRLLNAKIASN